MNKPHKHRDVIIAWANGEEIEIRTDYGGWIPLCTSTPQWHEDNEYRIKPKRVKKEGWVNVYPVHDFKGLAGITSNLHQTKELANQEADSNRVACIRIEWEEET